MITHHPGEDLLLSYSAGSLGESWSLGIATHLALCPTCRGAVAAAEEVGGLLLEDSDSAEMPANSLDKVLALLDEPAADFVEDAVPAGRGVLPQPLRGYVGGDVDSIGWKSIGGGAYQYLLDTADSAQARLLLIPEGKPVPEHGHRGREVTLVLAGSFTDQVGKFGRGDLEDADADLVHSPTAGGGEDCVCLAITDAPLKFRGLLPRLAQPFIKI